MEEGGGVTLDMADNAGDMSLLATAAATAAETAVLKLALEGETGSGPRRSWKKMEESINDQLEKNLCSALDAL